uniref:Uncharacterized protein n=1 Tax=Eutreptiella gymnastica TaxID=73025 RepID=A0A7S4G172_9EUGL
MNILQNSGELGVAVPHTDGRCDRNHRLPQGTPPTLHHHLGPECCSEVETLRPHTRCKLLSQLYHNWQHHHVVLQRLFMFGSFSRLERDSPQRIGKPSMEA